MKKLVFIKKLVFLTLFVFIGGLAIAAEPDVSTFVQQQTVKTIISAGIPVVIVLFACCQTLTGINSDNCNLSVGGIKTAWVACWDNVQTPTVTDDKISAIIGSASGTGATWKEYQFKKNTGQFTSTWTVADNGIKFVATDIVLQFREMETPKSIEINNLAASGIAMIVKDVNNKYWYFGYDDYLELTAGDAVTGVAKGDFNGYNVTLHDESDVLPYELAETAITQLLTEDA